jgi:glucose-1-phosphate thymidylyltransferase
MESRGLIVVEDVDDARDCRRPGCGGALEHVANRPIAHHVLEMLQAAGVNDVVVASSARRSAEVRESLAGREPQDAARLRYVEAPGSLDFAGALRLAAPIVGDAPCVAHLANGLLGEPLAPFVDRMRRNSPDVVLIMYPGPAVDGRLSAAIQDMLHIAQLDPGRPTLGVTGVWLFGPGALRHGATAPWTAGGDVDLTMVADRITAAGGSLDVQLADAWRLYTGNPLELLDLNRFALDLLGPELLRPDNNGNQIEGRVRIDESASVRGSVIVGPTVIGPGACIADAYIGPYTSIGAGARVEGTEIERSIISAGASIMHIGGRLVSSVVGRDARIFRDFSLPRALRLHVGEGTEVALC